MPQATDKNTVATPAPYYAQSRRSVIRGFVLSEMMRGAGYAALVIVSIGLLLKAIYLLGLLLPEDSKNAPPPMPYSQVQTVAETADV